MDAALPNTPAPLRIATYNIQAGIGSHHVRHVVTHSVRYVMPHRHTHHNLGRIAKAIEPFDIVALQEADAGSFRSRYIHQTDHLAGRADFPYTSTLVTREIRNIACITLGLLSRVPWERVTQHRLPASRHGRGAMEATFHVAGQRLTVIATHLSLSRASRMRQMRFLAKLVNRHDNVVLMGDLNCPPDAPEMRELLATTHLRLPSAASSMPATFPSWRPQRTLDYILTGGTFRLTRIEALSIASSDHLPVTGLLELAGEARSAA